MAPWEGGGEAAGRLVTGNFPPSSLEQRVGTPGGTGWGLLHKFCHLFQVAAGPVAVSWSRRQRDGKNEQIPWAGLRDWARRASEPAAGGEHPRVGEGAGDLLEQGRREVGRRSRPCPRSVKRPRGLCAGAWGAGGSLAGRELLARHGTAGAQRARGQGHPGCRPARAPRQVASGVRSCEAAFHLLPGRVSLSRHLLPSRTGARRRAGSSMCATWPRCLPAPAQPCALRPAPSATRPLQTSRRPWAP